MSEDSGHTHALQRSDVQPNSGRGADCGVGRGGRGGHSTPYGTNVRGYQCILFFIWNNYIHYEP